MTDKSNYRPISILPVVSKLYERVMQKQIADFIDKHLYVNMCGYRKGYSTQYALLTLLEKWKLILDKQGYAGAIIMDLSKAFDTINHELLLAKLHAYGFDKKALLMINSYLSNRWHRTRINSSFSTWEEVLHGVPQGSVLGPLLFNIYFNDLFYTLDETNASNYADDTNLHACDIELSNLLRRLEHDAHIAIEWFESNYMQLNKGKCHLIIIGNHYEHLWVNVGETRIWESEMEKVLGVNIDSKLNFDYHVDTLIKNAGKKVTILARMSNILNFHKLRIIMKSFFDSQFSYCPLVWMFCSRTHNNRINKLQERALRIVYKDDISTFQQLLNHDNSVTIHDRNIQLISIEMYKVKNNISPSSLSDFVDIRATTYNLRNKPDFQKNRGNTVHYGTESIRVIAPKIWDLIPNDIKRSSSINSFKSKIKSWKTDKCPCRLCKTYISNVGFL